MKIKIKNLSVDMDVKNKGIEFQVHDNSDNFKGDMYITKTGLIWCNGKTTRANGKQVSWDDFIDWMNS